MCGGPEILALAAGGIGAAGSLYGGFRSNQSLRLQSEIARGNADFLLRQADVQRGDAKVADARAGFEEARLRTRVDAALGGQTAFYGAGGLDITSGSPLVLAAASAAQGEVDGALIRAQGLQERAGAFTRAASSMNQAAGTYGQAYGMAEKGNDALIAGAFGAAASLIGAGAKAWGGLSSGASGAASAANDQGGFNAPPLPINRYARENNFGIS